MIVFRRTQEKENSDENAGTRYVTNSSAPMPERSDSQYEELKIDNKENNVYAHLYLPSYANVSLA